MWGNDLFHVGLNNALVYLRIMMVVTAIITLLFCLIIRWISKKYPLIFKLSMILHVLLLIYTINLFSKLDEPVRLSNNSSVNAVKPK
ncbi:hypothetical protein J2Z65_002480 [Paenibacillus aceris]|uniref:DUF5658 domain-containing protein n=1 Tax=Paenibacillus aceris TaxID=869555 RepID=A0ABS4HZB3_9BACL|nr:hypothetical protein [Paenibacillus aceris]